MQAAIRGRLRFNVTGHCHRFDFVTADRASQLSPIKPSRCRPGDSHKIGVLERGADDTQDTVRKLSFAKLFPTQEEGVWN